MKRSTNSRCAEIGGNAAGTQTRAGREGETWEVAGPAAPWTAWTDARTTLPTRINHCATSSGLVGGRTRRAPNGDGRAVEPEPNQVIQPSGSPWVVGKPRIPLLNPIHPSTVPAFPSSPSSSEARRHHSADGRSGTNRMTPTRLENRSESIGRRAPEKRANGSSAPVVPCRHAPLMTRGPMWRRTVASGQG